jgi:hypothetical protein
MVSRADTAAQPGLGTAEPRESWFAQDADRVVAAVDSDAEHGMSASEATLTKVLGIIAWTAVAFIVVVGALRGMSLSQLLLLGTAMAISAIPTVMPAFVSGLLSFGARELARGRSRAHPVDGALPAVLRHGSGGRRDRGRPGRSGRHAQATPRPEGPDHQPRGRPVLGPLRGSPLPGRADPSGGGTGPTEHGPAEQVVDHDLRRDGARYRLQRGDQPAGPGSQQWLACIGLALLPLVVEAGKVIRRRHTTQPAPVNPQRAVAPGRALSAAGVS